jgi:hypothetical protein
MKRLVAGGVALGFAATAAVTMAVPAGADEVQVDWDLTELDWDSVDVDHTPLEGSMSPDAVAPGGEVTVTGECNLQRISDPSHPHEIRWALVEPGAFPGWEGLPEGLSFPAVDEGRVDVPGLDAENSFNWEFTFEAPAEGGDYSIVAVCVPKDLAAYQHCWVGTYGPSDLTFEVDEDLPPVDEGDDEEEPETPEEEEEEDDEAPDTTPAAEPVGGTPSFTG